MAVLNDAARDRVGAAPEVVGGEGKGGILVREEASLSSPALAERLGTGSRVRQLRLRAGRLQYQLLEGAGPPTGWVSLRLAAGDLLARAGPLPGSPPIIIRVITKQ